MILILGGKDVSEYVVAGYNVNKSPVYDSASSFTNMLGQTIQPLIGYKYSLNCNIEGLDKETAESVFRVCETDSLEVTFAYPVEMTQTFKSPHLTSELTVENPEEWDISLSMETDTIPIDGL